MSIKSALPRVSSLPASHAEASSSHIPPPIKDQFAGITLREVLGAHPPSLEGLAALEPKPRTQVSQAGVRPMPYGIAQENIIGMMNDYFNRPYVLHPDHPEVTFERSQEFGGDLHKGVCHGLSMLFLYYASIGQAEEWTGYLGVLVERFKMDPEACLNDPKFNAQLEWLSQSILWLHAGNEITTRGAQFSLYDDYPADAHGTESHSTPSLSLAEVKLFYGTHDELILHLNSRSRGNGDECILVSSKSHTTACFREGSSDFPFDYHYDPNIDPHDPMPAQYSDKPEVFHLEISKRYSGSSILEPLNTGISYSNSKLADDPQCISSLLAVASMNGNYDAVMSLLASGKIAKISSDAIGDALYLAAQNGYADIVKLLLDIPGINVNKMKPSGATALSLAAEKGHTEIVAMLLAVPEINPNTVKPGYPNTASLAAMHGRADTVALLLSDARVDINQPDAAGRRALHYAANNNHCDVLRILLSNPKIDRHVAASVRAEAEAQGRSEVVKVFAEFDIV